MNFAGKNILITGGGSGFGLAAARHFAAHGARIIIVDRQEERSRQVLGQLEGGADRDHHAIIQDLQAADAAGKVVGEVLERFGRIDVLVNSAGVCHFNKIDAITPAEWDEVMEIDVRALFFMSTRVAEAMKAEGQGGRIINLGSNASRKGRALSAHYAAAKAAVSNLTESLALAYGPSNITVNTVNPAVVLTQMWEQNFAELARHTGKTSEQLVEMWTQQTPLKRLGTVDDIANLIVFLASDQAAFITAQHINVCGGFMLTC